MKKTFLTAAFAALALGAAQAVNVSWTSNNTSDKTLTLTNGCGTVVALISTPAGFAVLPKDCATSSIAHLHARRVRRQPFLHLHGG